MNATRVLLNSGVVPAVFTTGPKCRWAFLIVGLLLFASSANAQVGRYYLTDEFGFATVWQFEGGALVSTFPAVPATDHGAIVVDAGAKLVRTVPQAFEGIGPFVGSEYDLAGAVQGPVSLDLSAHPGSGGRIIDAGFDGQDAYVVASNLGGSPANVYRFNGDFSGPGALVFSIPAPGADTAQGITYDTRTNTIWTSDYDFNVEPNASRVRQWSLTGVELFSFPVIDAAGTGSERNTALAYDASDDTFWLNAHVENTLGFGVGELWQFDRNGNFLQAIHGAQLNPNAPTDILYWGGEILPIPEPSTLLLTLAGCGIVVALRRIR